MFGDAPSPYLNQCSLNILVGRCVQPQTTSTINGSLSIPIMTLIEVYQGWRLWCWYLCPITLHTLSNFLHLILNNNWPGSLTWRKVFFNVFYSIEIYFYVCWYNVPKSLIFIHFIFTSQRGFIFYFLGTHVLLFPVDVVNSFFPHMQSLNYTQSLTNSWHCCHDIDNIFVFKRHFLKWYVRL